MNDAQLLKLAHERKVRIDVAVPTPHFEHAARFRLASLLLHRGDVIAKYGVFERRDQLGIVMIVAEIGMTVRIGPDADLRLPEAVWCAVLAHLPDRDFS